MQKLKLNVLSLTASHTPSEKMQIRLPGCVECDESEESDESGVIGCMICITQNAYDNIFTPVCSAIPGTMRCQTHTMRCGYCNNQVECDSFLLCDRCCHRGVSTRMQRIMDDYVNEEIEWQTSVCLKDSLSDTSFVYACFPTLANLSWTCGCLSCIKVSTQFYVSRAVEEGSSPCLTAPTL